MKTNRMQEAYNRVFSKDLEQRLTEFNSNHGPDGRFTSASGATSSVSAGHGASSHRYTAKDIIGGSNVKRKQGGGRRFEKGPLLAGRAIKTKPGEGPMDAVHTKGTFGDHGSVSLNQRAIKLEKDFRRGRSKKVNQNELSAEVYSYTRKARTNAPKEPFYKERSEELRGQYRAEHGKRVARTQAKVKSGAAALKAPNISTKGGYKFSKVGRFRPRGRK